MLGNLGLEKDYPTGPLDCAIGPGRVLVIVNKFVYFCR